MAVEVKMPQLGESVHEGTIGSWLKEEGETVEKYEPLLEVITDKVDTEVTAVESGTLLEILVAEGETVSVGTTLAVLGEPGEEVEVSAATAPAGVEAEAEPAATAAGDGQAVATGERRVSPVAARMAAEHGIDLDAVDGSGPGGRVRREDIERHLEAAEAPSGAPAVGGRRPEIEGPPPGFISPRVARLAAEHGVDLSQVEGTGRNGRVTARDVEAHVEAREAAPAAPPPVERTPTEPARRRATPSTAPTPGELIEHTPMRRAIAEHMVHSKQTAPHVTTVHEVDMSAVVAARASLKPQFAERGVKLTYTAFIVDAIARTLAEHPRVNSSWTDEGVQTHRDINIGLAVAIEGGLIVPVLRNADEKSLRGIARDVNDLADRARNRGLSPDDVQGGTFTITNYGTLGALFGTPVINQPQTAILGTGAIKKRVVVVEGPEGDAMAIRPMMFLALTFDHRVLDGGTADPFVRDVIERLESY